MTTLTPDTAARLDRLYRLHHNRVLQVARAWTKDVHTAQDVAATAWVKVAQWLPTLRNDDEHAGPWLATITRRTAADHYRRGVATDRPMDWAEPLSSHLLPATRAAEDEALDDPESLPERLRSVLEALPEHQRTALQWRADGLSYRGMAAHSGSHQGWMRATRQGLDAMRTALISRDMTPPESDR